LINTTLLSRLKKQLVKLDYLPRWMIFAIDVMIISFTIVITHYMMLRVGMYYIYPEYRIIGIILFLSVYVVFLILFKIFAGIIRHSSFIDAIKLFLAVLSSLIVLFILSDVLTYIFGIKVFLNTGLTINAVLIFCTLFIYRIIVKFFFENYLSHNNKIESVRAIIYGADANALFIANSIILESSQRFKLVGFVSKNVKDNNKRLLDLPILKVNKRISVLMRSKGATALIIPDVGLSKEEKNNIVDDLLEYNMKVFIVPKIENWEDKTEISNKIQKIKIEDLLEREPIILHDAKIKKQHSNKIVLVSGAAGSIGSEIVNQILKYKVKMLILIDQAETPLHNLILSIIEKTPDVKIVPAIGDIKDELFLESIFKKYSPELVYHAAAYKHVPIMEESPYQAVMTNVFGTKNLADLSILYKVEKFVMISTDKAVNPSNVMGASKRIAEMYVQNSFYQNKSTKFITTRFGNVLGSNGSVVPLFTKQVEEGGPITLTHPDIIRYFMTIPEACQLVLEAGTMGSGGEIFIFDMGKPVKILDLAKKIIKLAGFIPEKDIKIKYVGLRPGEKLYEELLTESSKTLPTYNDKIMISEEDLNDLIGINSKIDKLKLSCKLFDSKSIVAEMKEIVPEFKSLNSSFSLLDK